MEDGGTFLRIALWCAVLGLIPALIAEAKGRSFGGFWFYGTLLFPLALIHSLIMKDETRQAIAGEQENRECPFCAEIVKAKAVVCRYCHRDLPAALPTVKITSAAVADQTPSTQKSIVWMMVGLAIVAVVAMALISVVIRWEYM
jgi:hypothetical protein